MYTYHSPPSDIEKKNLITFPGTQPTEYLGKCIPFHYILYTHNTRTHSWAYNEILISQLINFW